MNVEFQLFSARKAILYLSLMLIKEQWFNNSRSSALPADTVLSSPASLSQLHSTITDQQQQQEPKKSHNTGNT